MKIGLPFSTKTDVMNLLESAGFSRSNPYYVVQQGKIASLMLMKDSEQLELLKEIGGTHVYEDRPNSKKQIDLVSNYLEERLRELDEGKEEQMKYQQLDKQRRSTEYNILDHELNEASNELASVVAYGHIRWKSSPTFSLLKISMIGCLDNSEHWT
ncbi:hypothetical protein EJB05_29100, partial [Eragrostis curvula]